MSLSNQPRCRANPDDLSNKLAGDSIEAVLFKGAGGAFAVRALGMGIALGLQILLARVMGVDHFGTYIYVLTWINILSQFSRFGLDVALIRFIPSYVADEKWDLFRGIMRRSDRIVLLNSIFLGLVCASFIWLLKDRLSPELFHTFLMGCGLLPILALLGLRQSTLRSLKDIVRAQLPDNVLRPCLLAGLVTFLYFVMGKTIYGHGAMGLQIPATVIAFIIAALWLQRAIPAPSSITAPTYATRQWLRVSFVLLWVSQMQIILNQTDIVLIGILLGTNESGIYAVASRLAQLIVFGLNACIMISAPLISELYTLGNAQRLQRVVTLTAWIATLSSLATGIFLILGREIALGLFGEAFLTGSTVLIILVCGQLINALTGPVGVMLNMTGNQDTNAKILTCIALLNLFFNYPAILLFGINGAAMITSILIGIRNLWTWYEVSRRTGINSSVFRFRLIG